MPHEEKLRDQSTFTWGKSQLQAGLTAISLCLQWDVEDHQGDGAKFFQVLEGKRTRASRHKLKEKSFRVDIRELLFHLGIAAQGGCTVSIFVGLQDSAGRTSKQTGLMA